MTHDPISISTLLNDLTHGSLIVQGVLYFLMTLSLFSWFLIAYKALELWRAHRTNRVFVREFWNSNTVSGRNSHFPRFSKTCPFAQLTETGLATLKHYRSHREEIAGTGEKISENLTRALRQEIDDQINHFEGGLGVLATIGNTAPFIGLFGTVIGIMAALKGISRTGSAGLDVVAGPIGDALIATGAGIGCAVPAVVAYNFFIRRIRVLNNALDSFAYDLLTCLMTDDVLRGVSKQETGKQETEVKI